MSLSLYLLPQIGQKIYGEKVTASTADWLIDELTDQLIELSRWKAGQMERVDIAGRVDEW